MAMKCLLIGGCGFIGSSLIPKLIASDRSITVIDKRKPSNQDKVVGVTYIFGDFSDTCLIERLVLENDEFHL